MTGYEDLDQNGSWRDDRWRGRARTRGSSPGTVKLFNGSKGTTHLLADIADATRLLQRRTVGAILDAAGTKSAPCACARYSGGWRGVAREDVVEGDLAGHLVARHVQAAEGDDLLGRASRRHARLREHLLQPDAA